MNFRMWCQEKWYEHVDEMIALTGFHPSYRAGEYFTKYKYWLKREYRYQNANQN